MTTMQFKEKYTLTWHSYSDHLREALKEMMTTNEFSDVTLVTDDKQQIRAHRNILSACSPVFKDILQLNSNNTNPVIYLRGIQHSEMESIMQFVYLGEARFDEEKLSEFLMVSKNLEIKELLTGLENIETKEYVETEANTDSAEQDHNIANDTDLDINEDSTSSFNEDSADVEPQKQTKLQNKSADRRVKGTTLESVNSQFTCQDCEKVFNSKGALIYHIKSKHEGIKYTCNQCNFQASAMNGLKMHVQAKHEGVKYTCNHCDKQYAHQSDLTTHIQSKHKDDQYACNLCEYQGGCRRNLTRHIHIKHEGASYACNQCDFEAGYRRDLRRHIQRKHL